MNTSIKSEYPFTRIDLYSLNRFEATEEPIEVIASRDGRLTVLATSLGS